MIAGMPSQLNRGSRGPTRSLRQMRNGGGMLKTMPLATSSRNSSTLPRVSPRTTGPVSLSVCVGKHKLWSILAVTYCCGNMYTLFIWYS